MVRPQIESILKYLDKGKFETERQIENLKDICREIIQDWIEQDKYNLEITERYYKLRKAYRKACKLFKTEDVRKVEKEIYESL